MEKSTRFTLNRSDVESIGRGALMAAGGAVVVYLLQVLPGLDFGQSTPIVVALASIILNAARKFFAGEK